MAPVCWQSSARRLATPAPTRSLRRSDPIRAIPAKRPDSRSSRSASKTRPATGTNFTVAGRFRPHAVGDGLLITGQQQYSGTAAARLVIQPLGR